MSIWLEAHIEINTDKLDTSKCPISAVKQVFKKYGYDFDKPYSEGSIKRADYNTIKVSICNPDSLTDVIHNSFKQLVKQYAFIRRICITSHYYS